MNGMVKKKKKSVILFWIKKKKKLCCQTLKDVILSKNILYEATQVTLKFISWNKNLTQTSKFPKLLSSVSKVGDLCDYVYNFKKPEVSSLE